MNLSTEEKYIREVCLVLRREGFEVDTSGVRPTVMMDDSPICEVSEKGGVMHKNAWVSSDERMTAKDKAFDITCTVGEYMRQLQTAPPLVVGTLEDKYKVLADFNGTVFAAMESKYGVQFVTWDWDFNRMGLSHGNYFGGNYVGAKQDFATRSGLIPKEMLFTEAQRIEIYRCCADTLDAGFELTSEQEECIKSIQEQIEDGMPDIHDRIREQDAQNEEILFPEQNM